MEADLGVTKGKLPLLGKRATGTAHRRAARHQHSQYLVATLARLAKPESRCLVPANSFAEYAPEPNPATGEKDVVWFALNDDRPLFAFAGIWTVFEGDRGTKSKPIPGPSSVRVSHDGAEHRGQADPFQGHAGNPDNRRRTRRLDARTMG